ncbi:MAG TPA: hypothetical protein VK464_12760 [Symbiobacteriaceae bacterium]|jgi:hypothetical protein|nr:hypothetical protein [Symbiobacteriaceae bacterium]
MVREAIESIRRRQAAAAAVERKKNHQPVQTEHDEILEEILVAAGLEDLG